MTILVRLVLAVLMVICQRAILSRTYAGEVRYDISDEVLINPERGFYEQFTARSEGEPLSRVELERLREQNISLLLRLYYLEKFRDMKLSAEQLDLITADFRTIRESGCKCILRFAYSRNLDQPDAPLDIVLKHIEQLKPILHENADVIAALQAGFIGAWGEWHGSTNGLETPDAMRRIASGLLDALPKSRCIQVRTPAYKRIIVGNDSYLTDENAFNGMPQARIGHHNDCFLADETDVGTYNPNRVESDKRFLALDSRFVPMGGETCQPSRFTERDPAQAEFARMHWTYLNHGFNRRVIEEWKSSGLYAEAEKRLGYRLALVSSDCDPTVAAGATWNVQFKVKNWGWAAPINPRDVILVLIPRNARDVYEVTMLVDLRFWMPGDEAVANASIGVPHDMPADEYGLYLKVVDPAERLRNRVEYTIRLANAEIWDPQSGLHNLKQTVVVTEENRGASYQGNSWFKMVEREGSGR